jgi:hypothetical protein
MNTNDKNPPHRHLAIGALAALLVVASGCKRKTEGAPDAAIPVIPPRLTSVEVEDRTPEDKRIANATVDVAALKAELEDRLRGSGAFRAGPPPSRDGAAPSPSRADPVADARVMFVAEAIEAPEVPDKGLVRVLVSFQVSVKPVTHDDGPRPWKENVQAGTEAPYQRRDGKTPDLGPLVQKVVARLISDLTGEYVARLALPGASDADVLAAIANADAGDVKEQAIRLAGDRRLKAAIDPLLALLSHDDENVRDAALGALLQMREPRTVSELGKSRSMRDHHEMRKIIEAIAILGGDEAISYLKFVEDAHEDEEIKKLAGQALVRIERRQKGSKAAP